MKETIYDYLTRIFEKAGIPKPSNFGSICHLLSMQLCFKDYTETDVAEAFSALLESIEQ